MNMMDTEEERAQMLTMLNRNLRQVTQLLTQLLDYSRLESGQEQVQTQSFDVSEMMHELGDSLQLVARERNLTITVDGPAQLMVDNDSVKVRRIAQNLLLNALGYTQTGGVTIRWSSDPAAGQEGTLGWQFSIQDTGPGLPTMAIARLLNQEPISISLTDRSPTDRGPTQPPFVSQPRSGAALGEGIGLVIVRQLVSLLKATIEVESEAGTGTLIRVRFPRWP